MREGKGEEGKGKEGRGRAREGKGEGREFIPQWKMLPSNTLSCICM